jgi:hypothetical protein
MPSPATPHASSGARAEQLLAFIKRDLTQRSFSYDVYSQARDVRSGDKRTLDRFPLMTLKRSFKACPSPPQKC